MMEEQKNPESVLLGQNLSAKDFELIRQLMQSMVGQKQELAYEALEGYEVPPATQFSMLKKPAVTIKDGHFNFNMACIRLFESVQYVLLVVNEKQHRLAVIPCQEEEMSAVDWARKKADDTWTNKQITNRDLVSKIGVFMHWAQECRYKILGQVRMSARGLILVFELDNAVMFIKQEYEQLDEETGETTTKKKDVKYYPEKYKGKIGMSYSDYAQARQMSLFQDFTNYFGQDGIVGPDAASQSDPVIPDKATADIAQTPVATDAGSIAPDRQSKAQSTNSVTLSRENDQGEEYE